MKTNPAVVCFGEILWDIFPDKKVIGGAPFNVAQRLHSQGHSVAMISKIGADENGNDVLKYLSKRNFPSEGIQKDLQLKTGEVLVTLNEKGSASYTIEQPVAWDAIEYTSEAETLAKNASVFIFGSLACRNTTSKKTLLKLLELASFSVFDVNLRAPFYNIELIIQLIQHAQFVKMNDEELHEITTMLGHSSESLKSRATWLLDKTKVKGICITRGDKGAFLIKNGVFYEHGGYLVTVEDTVGAGDSFLATLVGELFLKKSKPEVALQKACAVGALVASKAGANCELLENEIENIIVQIKK